ncbi:phosphatase PAP2 family protein [Streptacidiphilus sp. PB12-B1b]|uniref:phosphatase PAP2 family protein n=1 Tax=Streptacidiphilus sp. PB12-B1b TaxID=2705012 RepID=UPI0015FB7AFF|nr:phosphatase PAP2 family protein [Streptacidiphilus sp. PB12-B1b]QMU77627.1 phosphatase PAP2 family protein [Streptacidiphilus sp. PB12-B1b]
MKSDHAYLTRESDDGSARSSGTEPEGTVGVAPPAPASAQDGAAEPRRRWWRRKWGWEVLLVLYAIYDGSRLLVHTSLLQAQHHGDAILRLERRLHLSPERTLNHLFATHAWLGVPADFVYASLHYVITVAVLFWVWRSHRDHYRMARTWLGLATLLGVVGFVAFPTAPPRLLGSSYHFTDILAEHSTVGWWGTGGGGTPRGLADMSNEFAAMPSLHVGWALWCGLLVFLHARHRLVRLLGLVYPFAIAFVVMGTGNHYLLDCVIGALVALVSLWATPPLLRWSDQAGRAARRGLHRLVRR